MNLDIADDKGVQTADDADEMPQRLRARFGEQVGFERRERYPSGFGRALASMAADLPLRPVT